MEADQRDLRRGSGSFPGPLLARALRTRCIDLDPMIASERAMAMPDNGFTVIIDDKTGVIISTLTGFWDMPMVRSFTGEVIRQSSMLRARGLPLRMLVDSSDHPIQSQQVITGFQEFALTEEVKAIQTAVLVNSALAQRHANRVHSPGPHQIFFDRDEALKWLLET